MIENTHMIGLGRWLKTTTLCLALTLNFQSFAQDEQSYSIGDKVEPFSLPNAYGQMINAFDNDSKGYIIVFTNQQCSYVNLYESRIQALDTKYREMGYPLIAIEAEIESFELSTSALPDYIKKNAITYDYLIDMDNSISKSFQVQSSPQALILVRTTDGLRLIYSGSIDNNSRRPASVTRKYIEEAMDDILANRTLRQPQTKSIGCHITY